MSLYTWLSSSLDISGSQRTNHEPLFRSRELREPIRAEYLCFGGGGGGGDGGGGGGGGCGGGVYKVEGW